jgi:hypothetical protein
LAGTMGPRPAPVGLIAWLLKRHGANERWRASGHYVGLQHLCGHSTIVSRSTTRVRAKDRPYWRNRVDRSDRFFEFRPCRRIVGVVVAAVVRTEQLVLPIPSSVSPRRPHRRHPG